MKLKGTAGGTNKVAVRKTNGDTGDFEGMSVGNEGKDKTAKEKTLRKFVSSWMCLISLMMREAERVPLLS